MKTRSVAAILLAGVLTVGGTYAGLRRHAMSQADRALEEATGRSAEAFLRRIVLGGRGEDGFSWFVTYWMPDSTMEYEQAQVVMSLSGKVRRTVPGELRTWLADPAAQPNTRLELSVAFV